MKTSSFKDQTVEVSLKEFTEVLNENHDLKIQLHDINPWMKWIHFAHMVDSFRFFPRLFIGVYLGLLAYSGFWFMMLAAPMTAQASFVATVWAAGAAWFGLYVGSGWKQKSE